MPFAAAGPELVPFLFGEQWRNAGEFIPLVTLAALISGPMGAVVGGYLFALGRAGAVIRSSAASAIVCVAVAAPLLPSLTERAVGIGTVCGAIALAVVLNREARRAGKIEPLEALIAPLAAAVIGGAAGLAITLRSPHSLGVAITGAIVGLVVSVLLLLGICRQDLADALSFTLGAISDAATSSRARTPRQA